jgi:hypothetical protein
MDYYQTVIFVGFFLLFSLFIFGPSNFVCALMFKCFKVLVVSKNTNKKRVWSSNN